MPTHTVTLTLGYSSTPGAEPRREVEIGRRVTGADLMRVGDLPESRSSLQLSLGLLAAAITKFGDLPIPVPVTVLLSLKSIDREDLAAAYADFLAETGAGRSSAEKLSGSRLRLGGGFQIGGVTYDVVEFGNLLSGYDELEAEEFGPWTRNCFLIGRHISAVSQSGEGGARREGPVEVEAFETLDAEDVYELNAFVPQWKSSFRRAARKALQPDAGAGGDLPAATPARVDGGDGTGAQP